jgi:hypothetical protein
MARTARRPGAQLQRASRADVERAITRAVAELERRGQLGRGVPASCPAQADPGADSRGAGEALAAFVRQHRVPLSASAAIGGADLVTLAAHAAAFPFGAAALGTAVAAAGGRVAWNHRPKAKRRKRARRGAYATWAACTAAASAAAAAGVANGPGQAVMLGGGLAVAAPYLWHHRRRPAPPELAELPQLPAVDPHLEAFAARFGSKAPCKGAEIHSARPVRDGFQFELALSTADGCTTAAVQKLIPDIAALYDVSADQVTVEYTKGRSERRARVSVLTVRDAFERADPWDGTSTYDPETGCFRLGRFADSADSHWMLHRPGSGAAGGVIAGVIGSGKTGTAHVINCEAGQAKLDGRRICAVWIGDPQEQPFGVWRGRADVTGWGSLGCVHMLMVLYFGMRARAAARGTMEWTDHLGRVNTGKGWFDPSPDEAEILATIDEWPLLAADPILGPLAIALAGAILKEGRKVGIALMLLTQLPDLSELGERVVREMLKAFNALAHRTDGLSKSMLGVQGDPTKLAPGVHGLGYLNGADQRPAATQRTKHLPEYVRPGQDGPDVREITERIANDPVELGDAFTAAAAELGYTGRGLVLDGSQWTEQVAVLARVLVKPAVAVAILAETCPEALAAAAAGAAPPAAPAPGPAAAPTPPAAPAPGPAAAPTPPGPDAAGMPPWLPILAVDLAQRGEVDLYDVSELAGVDVFEAERALGLLVHAGMAVQTGPDRWRTTMTSGAA